MASRQKTPRKEASTSTNSYHHGNLRSSLIDSGLVMLKESGPHNFSLRQLSESVGVTRTAPAHHFGDKNGLLAAIATRGYQKLVALRQQRIAAVGDDPKKRLVEAAASYVEFALDEPELFTLMFSTIIKDRDSFPDLVKAQREAFYGLAEYLDDYVGDREGELPKDTAAYGLWSLMHGVSTLKINQPGAPSTIQGVPNDTLSRQLAETLLTGALK